MACSGPFLHHMHAMAANCWKQTLLLLFEVFKFFNDICGNPTSTCRNPTSTCWTLPQVLVGFLQIFRIPTSTCRNPTSDTSHASNILAIIILRKELSLNCVSRECRTARLKGGNNGIDGQKGTSGRIPLLQ